ncbi:MAG: hypothetical protein K2P44_16050 [Lachnospiraceae bacterium]|nr:hypothetical protein [Lachnospiraceae bacterium]
MECVGNAVMCVFESTLKLLRGEKIEVLYSAIVGEIEAVAGAIAAIEAAPFAVVAGGAAVLGLLWRAITD